MRAWVDTWREVGQRCRISNSRGPSATGRASAHRRYPSAPLSVAPMRSLGSRASQRRGTSWSERLDALRTVTGHSHETLRRCAPMHARSPSSILAISTASSTCWRGYARTPRQTALSASSPFAASTRSGSKPVEALSRLFTKPAPVPRDSDCANLPRSVRIRVLDPALSPRRPYRCVAHRSTISRTSRSVPSGSSCSRTWRLFSPCRIRGAVAVHGGGHRVNLVARLPWAQRVTYWATSTPTDSRSSTNSARTESRRPRLMDTDTLLAHHDLWGEDPEPNIGLLNLLTPEETATLQLLSARGNVASSRNAFPGSTRCASSACTDMTRRDSKSLRLRQKIPDQKELFPRRMLLPHTIANG